MISTTAVSPELERLLSFVAEDLQLPPSLDAKARERYETLAAFLESSELSRFPLFVYAQGSYRIGTTVKPLKGEEYDLDFIVQLTAGTAVDPNQLMAALWNVMRRSDRYAGMVEPRPRCVRITYADEFHLDIVPGVPDGARGGTAILIPWQVGDSLVWHGTDPRGYAAWFDSQSALAVRAKEAMVEPLLPPAPASEKTSLQTAAQLCKRNHHVVVDERLRTPSVVLTTIAAQSAAGRNRALGETLTTIIERLGEYAGLANAPTIVNPAAPHEVISEKWSDGAVFEAFKNHARRVGRDWDELLRLQGTGVEALSRKLSEMFGEPAVRRAFKAAEAARQSARAAGQLSIGAGGGLTMGPTTRPNRPHTNYGGKEQ